MGNEIEPSWKERRFLFIRILSAITDEHLFVKTSTLLILLFGSGLPPINAAVEIFGG